MHQLYYPGMSSPSKIGMKMAACSPPKAVRKNESVRRKIAVGSVASVEAATAAPAGGSAEQSTTMTGIHPSEWPTLDFPHPVQPLALSSSSQAQAVLDSTPLQGKRHKKAESAQRGSSSTKHRDSATPAAAAAASVDTSGHRSIVGPAARTLVAVRLRPPNDSEREQQQFESCVAVDPAQKSVDVSRSFLNKKQYLFDAVFNESADTQEIYNSLIRPLVQRVDDGYNGVVTAYGQSATGKTYTFGSDGASVNSGCILRSCSALLESLYSDGSIDTRKGHLYISVGELYNEDMRDMLAADTMDKGRGRKICFEAHSHRLKGLSAHVITNMDECVEMIRKGSRRRSVHQDGVLGGSSHLGHLLIKFTLERARTCNERSTVRSTGGGGGGGDVMVRSSLSFVELAGSEWRDLNSARYFQVSGGRIPEDARQISNALSSLSALIHSRKNDMPLRGESKLSTLLHDALAGKVFWSLIITIGPSFDFLHETTTSLLFGKRAMLLENTPLWNHEPAILTVEKLSGSPLKSDFWFSPQPAGICSATPRKKIGGSTLKRGVKTVRQAQSMSPQARRKISFHHQSRVRSSARDHPDLDFSSYVARQLGVEETQADGIDDEDDNIAHALAPEMRNPPEHTEKPDRRNRKLAFEKSAPAHATRLSLSSSFKDGDEHGVSDAMYSGHGGAQNMVNPRQRVVAMDPFTFRLLLEDLLEAHGQVMSVHASMPSSMMLDEMHTRSHVSSFRDILKHLLALPEGAQLMMRMVQKALALLAADASGMSVVKSLDTPQRMDADFAADQVFIPVLQQLLSSDPGESSQVKAVGEDLSVSDVETRGVEAEALILRVLETAFDGKHIQRALHPPAADATDTDTDKDAEKQIASENNVYAAMSDLYTACTCDVMREGGMAAIHSTFPSRNQPEILQRLDSCLRQSQHQAGELHGYRQESIASAALCQSLAEQAIAGRRRASRLTRELERSSKMLRLLGEELLEEKRRSREKLVETERGWQDKMSFHKMALLEEKVNAFEEEKSQQQQFNISNVEDILGESGEKETLGKFDDDEDNSSTTSTHDKTARLKEVFEKIEAEAETMQQRSSGTGESEKIDGNDQMNTSPASQSSADKYARLENMFQQVKAAESKPHNATDADLQGGVNFKSDGKYQETTMSASTALNGDVVRNGEEDQIENTVIRITLGIDFSNAGVVGSGVRLAFEDTLCW